MKCHRKCNFVLSEIFVLIQLGIFLLKLGRKYMFCHWEHDRISAIKSTEKKPCAGIETTDSSEICIGRQQSYLEPKPLPALIKYARYSYSEYNIVL
jgi:hypothetical protein